MIYTKLTYALKFSVVFLSTIFLLSGCEKDQFKDYEKRIIGVWLVSKVEEMGAITNDLSFREGVYYFEADKSFKYVSSNTRIITGKWAIEKDWQWDGAECEECGMGNNKTLIIDCNTSGSNVLQLFILHDMKFDHANSFNATFTDNRFSATYFFTKQ